MSLTNYLEKREIEYIDGDSLSFQIKCTNCEHEDLNLKLSEDCEQIGYFKIDCLCINCSSNFNIFDTLLDGYDGVLGLHEVNYVKYVMFRENQNSKLYANITFDIEKAELIEIAEEHSKSAVSLFGYIIFSIDSPKSKHEIFFEAETC